MTTTRSIILLQRPSTSSKQNLFYRLSLLTVMYLVLFISSEPTLNNFSYIGRNAFHEIVFLCCSDGCANHHKGKDTLADLSLTSGPRVQRAFFGSEHRKGEADGETDVLSQAIDRAVKSGTNIGCTKDLFQ